ncbi:hypothetical protein D915_004969 [Fasciola hepatica]|uniref:Inositol phosphatase domain-containing protein n=1 Tax=Fasciola hepatica TaxID=6192 RepID=A0A4E0S135_FASHE|nr:hypothetical protein D915_004969 [Fasciola hepatica]
MVVSKLTTPPKCVHISVPNNGEDPTIVPDTVKSLHEVTSENETSTELTTSRPCLTSEGKIWPASAAIHPDAYFCSKLPRIDHWDHDQECTVCLTDKCLLLIGLSFITEKIQSVKRVPLNAIHTMRMGNLVSARLSLLPPRPYGAVQLIWGPITSTKWTVMWNPMSKDVPTAVFHHHPCYYSIKPLDSMELFDCDNMASRLREILEIHAVQPSHEDIVLHARFNPLNVFYNQSSLGFCKDRNGVNF